MDLIGIFKIYIPINILYIFLFVATFTFVKAYTYYKQTERK